MKNNIKCHNVSNFLTVKSLSLPNFFFTQSAITMFFHTCTLCHQVQ